MSVLVPDDVGFALERAVRVWHAGQGIPLVACTEMTGRNADDRMAPSIFLPERDFVLCADFLQVGEGAQWIEVKTRSYAPRVDKASRAAGCLVRSTGFMPTANAPGDWYYRQYRRLEELAGIPLKLLFAQLAENEIRGGTLDEIEPARTARVNLVRGGCFWEYELLPLLPLTVGALLDEALAARAKLDARARDYFTPEHRRLIREYRHDVAIPAREKYLSSWEAA